VIYWEGLKEGVFLNNDIANAPVRGDKIFSPDKIPGGWSFQSVILLLGLIVFCVPTMKFVIEQSWSGEEGAHGPIVLATGIWLLLRRWKVSKTSVQAPSMPLVWLLLAIFVPLQIFARITQIVEVEGYLMYATMLIVLYSIVGMEVMKRLWFPIFYLAFIFPPPETIVALATVPMKIWLSKAAIGFLQLFGYPIGGEGVRIYIGQYELLVAAACSGINSIISLSAISLFYIYMRHQADWRYSLLLVFLIVPVALVANFFRVLILILLTYHAGEATAQGFLHNFAGIAMFAIALLTIFAADEILKPIWDRYIVKSKAADHYG
tara:strand:+ start:74712 stop:75674 length:963 start_codon:yes stop_codon:yes gene_type:complete